MDPSELDSRRQQWEPLPPRYTRGVLPEIRAAGRVRITARSATDMSVDSNLDDLKRADTVLTDGGIETWIDFNSDYTLGDLGTIGMLDDGPGRAVLVDLETRYINAARERDLEIVIGTPSWHGAMHRLVAAGHPDDDVERLNQKCRVAGTRIASRSRSRQGIRRRSDRSVRRWIPT